MTLVLIVVAGLAQATVEYIRRLLPTNTSPLAVATVISLSGGLFGLILLGIQRKAILFSRTSIGLSVLAGGLVLILDMCLVSAYSWGVKLSTGIPLFLGAALFFGFIYALYAGEKLSWSSIVGSLFILVGSVLITYFNKIM